MAPTPSAPVLDNFLRANENPISGGGNWGTTWQSEQQMKVVSNQAASAFNGGAEATAVWLPLIAADMEVSAQILSTIGTDQFEVFARASPVGPDPLDTLLGFAYFYRVNGSGSNLYVRTGASDTLIGIGGPVTVSVGDYFAITVQGTTITGWVLHGGSWSAKVTATDGQASGLGRPGMGVWNFSQRLGNFAARSLDVGQLSPMSVSSSLRT